MSQPQTKIPEFQHQLLADAFGFFFAVLPGTLTLFVLLEIFSSIPTEEIFLRFVFIATFPYLAAVLFIIIVGIFRFVLPKMRAGRFRAAPNKGFLSWFLNFHLNRAVSISLLKPVIFSSNTLRFFYLRVMGARVPFRMTASLGISLLDLPLLTLGEGVAIGEGVRVSCHTFTGNFLVMSPVEIGEGTFIGFDSIVGPGTKIGKNSWIGARNAFLEDSIPEASFFSNSAWPDGNPEKMKKEIRLGASTEK